MQQIHIPLQTLDHFQDGTGEKDKSFAVVFVVHAPVAIDALAVKIVVLADKIDRHLTPRQATDEQAPLNSLATDRHLKGDVHRLKRLTADGNAPIGGNDHGDLVA